MTTTVEIESTGKYDFRIFLLILSTLSLFMVCWFGPVSEYSGHDYYFNIGRLEILMQALKEGNYPIYLDYDTLEGYGYFTKGFYPDLILLPFAVIGLLVGSVSAYNILIFSLTFLCGLFMYKAVDVVFKNSFIASVSSILYTFSAYHLFDWYNRAALGESISFTFLPLVFLGLYHILIGNYKKWYLLTIGYSLLLYTHLLSSFLTFLVIVIMLLLCCRKLIKEPKRIAFLLLAAVVTIPIVASYLFPMLEQMASNTFYYNTSENITGQTKLGLNELGWGMLSGILYPKDNNICGTGPLLIIILFLRLFIRERSSYLKMADFCVLIGVLLLIMTSVLFPWGRLPLGFIQFPWRLYEFIIFFFSIGGAYYLSVILRGKKQYNIAIGGIIIYSLLVMIINNENYKYWQTRAKKDVPEWFSGEPSILNQYYKGGLEYLPSRVPTHGLMKERGDIVISENLETQISNLKKEKGMTSFDIEAHTSDKLELPLIYYKGYKAELDSKYIPIEQSDNGLIQLLVNESGSIRVYYAGTVIQKISWYISLLSIVVFCIFIYIAKRRNESDI
ncbi:MAG: hypothetical protein ACK5KT_04165 [Dysgonomonas sp.]